MKNRFLSLASALLLPVFSSFPSIAADNVAKPWQLNFQEPASPVMEKLVFAHDSLLILITAISLFVLGLIIYICLRFNKKANPIASKTTHNVKLEVIWTVIPILILVAIAIPSLRLHYFMEDDVEAEMTLKVVGYQWYWHYDYPDHGGFGFDSYIKKKEDLKEGDHRLLSVDNHVVVPVDTKVRVLLTAGDVIHAWALPAFGVKRDAVPGRLNSSWFKATKIGRYYGQCSELCGVGHGFMPIVVDVVSKEDFATWVAGKQKEAGIDPATLSGAAADAQKAEMPVTKPVGSEHANPDKIIEKEKDLSDKKTQPKPAAAEKAVEKDTKDAAKDNGASAEE